VGNMWQHVSKRLGWREPGVPSEGMHPSAGSTDRMPMD
jgi:hypothetical protein